VCKDGEIRTERHAEIDTTQRQTRETQRHRDTERGVGGFGRLTDSQASRSLSVKSRVRGMRPLVTILALI
jgi:hypothetical protein